MTSSRSSSLSYEDGTESGYASASSSQEGLQEVFFTGPHLKFINAQLQKLEPIGMSFHDTHES